MRGLSFSLVLVVGLTGCGKGTPLSLRRVVERGPEVADGGAVDRDSGPAEAGPREVGPLFDGGPIEVGSTFDVGFVDAGAPDAGLPQCAPSSRPFSIRVTGNVRSEGELQPLTITALLDAGGNGESFIQLGRLRQPSVVTVRFQAPITLDRLRQGQDVLLGVFRETGPAGESVAVAIVDPDTMTPELYLFDVASDDVLLGLLVEARWVDQACAAARLDDRCPQRAVTQRLEGVGPQGEAVSLRPGTEVELGPFRLGLERAYRFVDGACTTVGPARRAGYLVP